MSLFRGQLCAFYLYTEIEGCYGAFNYTKVKRQLQIHQGEFDFAEMEERT